ncbi:hypothetical protein AJ80_09923 [Polytolypa hystricis UAMH7299]|uniref:Uncharacterized protein n=1 Tax=Polytolypa hystricis (strain UAMH7299) TaxID=1447883 RepID=A0A2B7WGM0_POLH7|nr:hypothetical protein AJ80_09923 [Polytolypa hystricis UAMH7299]
MAYHLAISVYGPGTDPNHRSHWGLLIYKPEENIGDLFHTPLIDVDRLWYRFEEGSGAPVVLDAVVTLEIEEVVEPGTTRRVRDLVGKSAAEVAEIAGEDWIAA